MTGVLQLINREYYETFTGSFSELKVPMMPKKRQPRQDNPVRNKNGFSTRALQYFQDVNIPLEANFWNQLKFRQGDIWKTMGQTSLKQVLTEMAGRKVTGYLTYDDCKNEALKYKTKRQFLDNANNYYQRAHGKNWLDDITSHMKPMRIKWTIELATECAKKYNGRGEFQKNDNPAYNFIKKNELLDELFPNTKKPGSKKGHKKSKELEK